MVVPLTVSTSNESSNPSSTLSLRTIIQSLPKACFEHDPIQAWRGVAVSVAAVALCYGLLIVSPWFLLPIVWFLTGTALTGFFVIAHDCGHRSFAKQTWVNDWVGHVLMLPLLYPFHSWRILHNFHHTHTNKLDVDNAWQPFQPKDYDQLHPSMQFIYRMFFNYFWWIGSIGHWLKNHFNWTTFEGKKRQQVKLSVSAVLGFAAVFFPTLIATTGLVGLVKFWLMPWLAYHFWLSTFTLIHHTADDIPFVPVAEWNAAESQLMGTVHCSYPHWIEVLCHDINVHVPHHISTAIPSYKLRLAHQSLKENWGDYIRERNFSFSLMKSVVGGCHLYDRDRNYRSFKQHHS